jgi:hypothetical protein
MLAKHYEIPNGDCQIRSLILLNDRSFVQNKDNAAVYCSESYAYT